MVCDVVVAASASVAIVDAYCRLDFIMEAVLT